MRGRGLTDEVIERWHLGYVLDPVTGHERFKGYLSIPYLTRAGTVALKFRCIKCDKCEGHPKYDGEKGQGTYLFGAMSFWRDSRILCVTEGEMDTIACDVAGLPAVGISGATKWLPHWQYCFEGFDEVIVLADGDTAGEKLTSNVTSAIYGSREVRFPDGEDVSSFLVKQGPEALRERVLGRG